MKYSRKNKKDLTKKYYKKKSNRFTKKKYGGFKYGGNKYGGNKYGGNKYGYSLARAPNIPLYPNTGPFYQNTGIYDMLDQNSIRSIGLNSPKIDEYNFLSELQSISDGNGNKGPPKSPEFTIIDFPDDDPRNNNKYEEYIIPLNENGILELGKALTKLGLNPQNILDILKKQVALSKKYDKLDKIKKIINLIDRQFKIIDDSLEQQILTREEATEYKSDIMNKYLTLSARKRRKSNKLFRI
jgi:hypothetical protein